VVTGPPDGLPGLEPAWSRLVTVAEAGGADRSWHVLDTGTPASVGTLLCVHGNPTWSYLWRGLLAAPPAGWRVVAPDQLGMGFSERLPTARSYAQRVDDLGRLTDALGITGTVVTVGHDWGGVISLGWAVQHRAQLRGIVLLNTAVHQPSGATAPALIRLASAAALRNTVCVRTPAFVRAATALSRPPLPRDIRAGYAAPYATAHRRQAVGDFVADIPLSADHPSFGALAAVTAEIGSLDVPALLLWGPRDPVFGQRYLDDLLERLPAADLHRYERASHLVTEDAPEYAAAVAEWVADLGSAGPVPAVTVPAVAVPAVTAPAVMAPAAHPPAAPAVSGAAHPPAAPAVSGAAPAEPARRPLWAALQDRAGDPTPAVVEVGGAVVSWDLLERRVRELAAGLAAHGVRPGERVALLVPPSADLTAAVYALWRAGGCIVVADKGLGLRGMGRALRGARVDHVIGTAQGLAAARAMRLPGSRIAAGPVGPTAMRALGAGAGLVDLARRGRTAPAPPEPPDDDPCAVVFTSGATGPAKGVRYRHRQVQAQLELVRSTYALTDADRLVAAFAPFALLGPGLGIGSAVPDVDVTSPGTLTAAALADAVLAAEATAVFASPAALRNVLATASALLPAQRAALRRVRLVMSAGAPVPLDVLRVVGELLPAADLHTPYGMTEALPVTDISLAQIEAAGPGNGVCVGRPLAGVDVAVSSLSPLGVADGPLASGPGVTGEICVRGEHVKDSYDALWATQRASARDQGWHRTGDVGHVDADGRLWIEGRLAHVVTTAVGVVTPVGIEQRVEELAEVSAAAVVGVGPIGTQQVVVVIVPAAPSRSLLAGLPLTDAVRTAAGVDVAAVLLATELPVDIRHASKVDRQRLAAWASHVLAGARV